MSIKMVDYLIEIFKKYLQIDDVNYSYENVNAFSISYNSVTIDVITGIETTICFRINLFWKEEKIKLIEKFIELLDVELRYINDNKVSRTINIEKNEINYSMGIISSILLADGEIIADELLKFKNIVIMLILISRHEINPCDDLHILLIQLMHENYIDTDSSGAIS